MKRSTRITAFLAAIPLALTLNLAGANAAPSGNTDPVAADAVALVECEGSARQDFNPPLMPYPQRVSIEEQGVFAPCLPNTQDIKNGSFILRGHGTLDCLVGGNSEGIYNIEWVRGDGSKAHSRAEYPLISITVRSTGQTVAIVTARITGGLFQGHTLVYEEVLAQYNVERCLLGLGVETLGGPMNLTVI